MPLLTTLIIADDLTGALDSVSPFAAVGLDCLVATSPDSLAETFAQGPQVLAINLGTREGDADAARTVARATARAALRCIGPATIWFKKIDSRMKGQVAAEVAGVIEVVGSARVVVCPAIPEFGRFVTSGQLTGAGVPEPMSVKLHLSAGVEVSTPDASCDADLDRVVQTSPSGTLFVGARGLAAALARRQIPGQLPVPVPMPLGAVGFCIGSRDPITLAQVEALRESADLPFVPAADGIVPRPGAAGEVLVLAAPGAGASTEQVATRLAKGFLDHLNGLKAVVVTGGETAAALLHSAGIGVLRVKGEVLPGLPFCYAPEIPAFPVIVTKSGGFGQADTLLKLWRAAHRQEGQPFR